MATYTIKVKLSKTKINRLKEKLKEEVFDNVAPVLTKTIRDIFLYKKMKPGQATDINTFRIANAGLFPSAIINKIEATGVKTSKPTETGVRVESIPNGTELVISIEPNEQAKKLFDQYGVENVLRDISNLNNTVLTSIFNTSAEKAGLD